MVIIKQNTGKVGCRFITKSNLPKGLTFLFFIVTITMLIIYEYMCSFLVSSW